MRQSPLLFSLLQASPGAAWLKYPFAKSDTFESWSPARQTSLIDDWTRGQVALGSSPRPTSAPRPIFGRMLVPRLDGFDLGPETCGYISSLGDSFTCISSSATCTKDGAHLGCCESNKNCDIIKTTCIGYEGYQAGRCDLPDDFHTLCCPDVLLPSCYTYILTETGKGGRKDSTYSLLDCNTREGSATLLDYDPAWSKTHSFGQTTSSETETETETSTNESSSDDDDEMDSDVDNGNGKKKKSNTGAIVGGALGGVVALAIIGVIIFFCIRRRKKNKTIAASPTPTGAHMSQYGPASSDASAMYPSGAPPGFQGYAQQQPQIQQHPQQPWNPQATTLVEPAHHQPAYNPHGYDSQAQQYQHPHYQGYNGPVYNPAFNSQTSPVSSPSPPVMAGPTPSPGTGGVTPITPHPKDELGPTRPVSELPAVNPLGSHGNRAEMG